MQQPVTELDPRFGDQKAVATGWEETRRVLEDAELFWITTVRVDGRPHVTPLVAVWLDDAIHFATGAGEQKAVNLRTNQNVILTTGFNEWEQGLDVVVEGEARPGDRRARPRTAGGCMGGEVGRALAVRGARAQLPARGWERSSPRLRGEAREGARVRQGHLRPDTPPILGACAPSMTYRF